MTYYEAPDPSVAELVYQTNAELARQEERLKNCSSEALKKVIRDTAESTDARMAAWCKLLRCRDPELLDLLLESFDDRDQHLWRFVIRSYRPDDARLKSRLRSLLDDEDERNWSAAAMALARLSDDTLLPRLKAWQHQSDRPHRNLAFGCLKALATNSAFEMLKDYWDGVCGDSEDRLAVADALLSKGDLRGLSYLEATARSGLGDWSVFAAFSIYFHQPGEGLVLILHILDSGDLSAKQGVVSQIWNIADLPHAFTADGIHEARAWIQTEMAAAVSGKAVT